MADNYFNEYINITVSVPRASFNRTCDKSITGQQQVVPDLHNFESGNYSDEGMVPSPKGFDCFERESFYDDFFGCIKKTPDDVKRVEQNYRLSSAGELKKLKERSKKNRKPLRKGSPWRLIIEEEDILTSSPVLKKPQASKNLRNSKLQKDQQAFLDFLKRSGWKTGIIPG